MANNGTYRHVQRMGAVTHLLQQLPVEVQTSILMTATAEAHKPVKAAMKRHARRSRRTGALEESIDTLVKNYPARAKALAVTGPDRGHYRGGKRVKKGGDFRGADRPANYAHLVESGHVIATKGGTVRRGTAQVTGFVPGKPFARPAGEETKQEVAARFTAGLEKGITKARDRLIREGAHRA